MTWKIGLKISFLPDLLQILSYLAEKTVVIGREMPLKIDEILSKIKAQIPTDLLAKIIPPSLHGKISKFIPLKSVAIKEGEAESPKEVNEEGKDGEKTKSKINKTQTASGVTENKDDKTDSKKDLKKPELSDKAKKKSKIIKLVVGAALVLLAADEFLNPPVDPGAVNSQVTKNAEPSPRPKKKKKEEIPTPDQNQNSQAIDPTPVAQVPEVQNPVQEVAPVENIVKTEEPVVPAEEVKSEVTAVTPEASTNVTNTVVENTADRVPSGSSDTVSTETTPSTDVSAFQMGETGPEVKVEESLKDQVKDPTSSEGGMDKVLTQLADPKSQEYVVPPTYEELGRGLVYNCKGKHWACINKDAYFKCRDNQKWNTNNLKPKECMTISVYATNEDCETIQIHHINVREKTDFCN